MYIDEDDVVFDAALNQTNISNNNNKFYRLQLVEAKIHGETKHWCTTRWGRVGQWGQCKLLGPEKLSTMILDFEKKFKDKTGLTWENRHEEPRSKKYTYLEREYDTAPEENGQEARDEAVDSSEPASKLPAPVQSLVKLIFNETSFDVALHSIGYDAKKLPLGKLGKRTLAKAFEELKEIEMLLQDPGEAQDLADEEYDGDVGALLEGLSNRYYSYVPHTSPGIQRLPVIDTMERLKTEVDMVDTLAKMEITAGMIDEAKRNDKKHQEKTALLDQHLQMLKLEQVTPIGSGSQEYKTLLKYLINTSGHSHNVEYDVQDIFRIRRQGEWDRFEKDFGNREKSCRRLLWHGSRTTNFGGILSQGLRIAPPEAPVSGYMFGKGIYLADISTKSANYCWLQGTAEHGLLLLCEAELGTPTLRLTTADYEAGEKAKEKGCIATTGVGITAPSSWVDAECVHPDLKGVLMPDPDTVPKTEDQEALYLAYNEYICYTESQVRLRYLIRFKDEGGISEY